MAMKSPPGDESPLRQGAGGDLLNPPRWDSRRRRLWKVFRIVALGTGGFAMEAISRRKGMSRGGTRGPGDRATRPGPGPPCHLATSWPHFDSPSVFWKLRAKIGPWAVISSNSENISLLGFLKPKTAQNSNWLFGILLIG